MFVRHKEVVHSSSQGGETEDHSYEIALDFVKEGITDLPKVVGHTGELQRSVVMAQ